MAYFVCYLAFSHCFIRSYASLIFCSVPFFLIFCFVRIMLLRLFDGNVEKVEAIRGSRSNPIVIHLD